MTLKFKILLHFRPSLSLSLSLDLCCTLPRRYFGAFRPMTKYILNQKLLSHSAIGVRSARGLYKIKMAGSVCEAPGVDYGEL